MESIYTWLISGGVVVVLGAAVYLYYRFAKTNSTTKVLFSVGGSLVKGLSNLLPNNAELDLHDITIIIGRLFEEIPKWASDPTNVTFDDCKDEVLAFVEQQRDVVPQLSKLPKETIERVASALFGLARSFLPVTTTTTVSG
jgi:hypothetical protein